MTLKIRKKGIRRGYGGGSAATIPSPLFKITKMPVIPSGARDLLILTGQQWIFFQK
jgi:hypothetical protein